MANMSTTDENLCVYIALTKKAKRRNIPFNYPLTLKFERYMLNKLRGRNYETSFGYIHCQLHSMDENKIQMIFEELPAAEKRYELKLTITDNSGFEFENNAPVMLDLQGRMNPNLPPTLRTFYMQTKDEHLDPSDDEVIRYRVDTYF